MTGPGTHRTARLERQSLQALDTLQWPRSHRDAATYASTTRLPLNACRGCLPNGVSMMPFAVASSDIREALIGAA